MWDEVEEHNRTHESEAAYQVTFYCGQSLEEDDG